MSDSKKQHSNNKTVKMTISWAALAAQNSAASAAPESEASAAQNSAASAAPESEASAAPKSAAPAHNHAALKDVIELPRFIEQIRNKVFLKAPKKGEKPVLGKHYTWSPSVFQCDCNSCKNKKMSPCFASVEDLRTHLSEHEDENRGFTFIQCPECIPKGFNTLVGTTPACLSEHCRKHHKDVLISLGLDPKKHSPVLLCMDCKEYTPFQHKHCYQCPKDSGCGFLAFKDQKELVAHLKEAHPRPMVKSFPKARGKAPVKVTISPADVEAWPELGAKPEGKAKAEDKVLGSGFLKKKATHERKQTLDVKGLSSSSNNAFASLASASDEEEES